MFVRPIGSYEFSPDVGKVAVWLVAYVMRISNTLMSLYDPLNPLTAGVTYIRVFIFY